MSTSVQNAKQSSKLEDVLSNLDNLRHVRCVEIVAPDSTTLQQFITELVGFLSQDQKKVTVDSGKKEDIKLEELEFESWLEDQIKHMTVKHAKNLLNDNAWKIDGISLYSDFGTDPETVWTGFLELFNSKDKETPISYQFEDDDVGRIIKKCAIMSQIYDNGE